MAFQTESSTIPGNRGGPCQAPVGMARGNGTGSHHTRVCNSSKMPSLEEAAAASAGLTAWLPGSSW